VQAEADGHATVFRKANCAPAGLGVGWMVHRVPSHRSASVPAFEFPAAVHADGDLHATPFRKPPPCEGLGVGWMVHRVPSHRSARVRAPGVKALEPPTAVQEEGNGHATALRKPPPWEGLGVGWMRQVAPSHRSARAWEDPAWLTLFPTAVHADGAVQETPKRELTTAPRGFGVGWMRHVLPFQCSARVTVAPEALT
jgi:hypothetical protein